MIFKLRAVLLSFIFTACFFISISWAAELTIPLPTDALKVSESTSSFGPIKLVTRIYESSFTQAKVVSFYKQEMLRAGWVEDKDGVFRKDNYMVVVIVNSSKDEAGKISFSNTISYIPAKEKFSALPKIRPDKLNFMPVYPGSMQLFLLDTPIGVKGSYETGSSIKEVISFYKSGMLDYGWILDNETPIKAGVIDCSGCRKATSGVSGIAGSKIASTESTAKLAFRRKDRESCAITIANISINQGDSPEKSKLNNGKGVSLPNKTTILVNYNAYTQTKP